MTVAAAARMSSAHTAAAAEAAVAVVACMCVQLHEADHDSQTALLETSLAWQWS